MIHQSAIIHHGVLRSSLSEEQRVSLCGWKWNVRISHQSRCRGIVMTQGRVMLTWFTAEVELFGASGSVCTVAVMSTGLNVRLRSVMLCIKPSVDSTGGSQYTFMDSGIISFPSSPTNRWRFWIKLDKLSRYLFQTICHIETVLCYFACYLVPGYSLLHTSVKRVRYTSSPVCSLALPVLDSAPTYCLIDHKWNSELINTVLMRVCCSITCHLNHPHHPQWAICFLSYNARSNNFLCNFGEEAATPSYHHKYLTSLWLLFSAMRYLHL